MTWDLQLARGACNRYCIEIQIEVCAGMDETYVVYVASENYSSNYEPHEYCKMDIAAITMVVEHN